MNQLTRIESAQRESGAARRRFAATLGLLQYRLKPTNIATNAWEGAKERGGAAADGAVQSVKERPVAASGAAAAVVLILARRPIGSAFRALFGRNKAPADGITTRIDTSKVDYGLTAPVADLTLNEGARI